MGFRVGRGNGGAGESIHFGGGGSGAGMGGARAFVLEVEEAGAEWERRGVV